MSAFTFSFRFSFPFKKTALPLVFGLALVFGLVWAAPVGAVEPPAAQLDQVAGELAQSPGPVSYAVSLGRMEQRMDQALAGYTPGKPGVSEALIEIYYQEFVDSGLETDLESWNGDLDSRLELSFTKLVGLLGENGEPQAVRAAWLELQALMAQTASLQPVASGGFGQVFWQSFLIMVREGFEAMLIVTALAAYLRRQGQTGMLKVVYQGVVWALLASLAMAWLFNQAVTLSGASREAMEGMTLLLASLVLFYISFWLLSKREAKVWQDYLKRQVGQALGRGGVLALGLAAFLAVFREGAETVLFYQALMAGRPGGGVALLSGMGAGVVGLLAMYLALRSATLRLPMGLFFTATAALLYYMALVFAGRGVFGLQAAHWLPHTPVGGVPYVGWLGLFPSFETVGVQLALLLPGLAGLLWLAARRFKGPPQQGPVAP